MAANFKWYGAKVQAALEAEMRRRLRASAIVVSGHAKRLISKAGTVTLGQGKSAKRVYGANPSPPGQPPHKQTGRLRASVAWELDSRRLIARVGTNVRYGRFLELGTRKMAARPWLRRALKERRSQIRSILSKPMNLK